MSDYTLQEPAIFTDPHLQAGGQHPVATAAPAFSPHQQQEFASRVASGKQAARRHCSALRQPHTLEHLYDGVKSMTVARIRKPAQNVADRTPYNTENILFREKFTKNC